MSNSTFLKPLNRLVSMRPNSSLILMIATVLAVIIANTSWSGIYQEILHYPVNLQIGRFNVFSHHGEVMDFVTFANDVLMVFFFFQVGLEIKQEILVGELSTPKKALLPVVGAMGGMLMPVLLFYVVCHKSPDMNGIAIPMATDIAFVIAILAILGSKVPPALKAFITSLAVADDIGGIIVIALFYSSSFQASMLLFAGIALLVIYLLGRSGVRALWVYYVGLFFVWYFLLQSGIHTTIAGVLVAFVVPAATTITTEELGRYSQTMSKLLPTDRQRTSKRARLLPHEQLAVVHSIGQRANLAISPLQRLEHQLTDWVSYLILPLFAFVNAGVTLGGVEPSELFNVPLAVFLGLFVGKPLGITLFSYIFIRLTGNVWPSKVNFKSLFGVSILGGIGFTVALFIATLSYDAAHEYLLNEAKMGIFAGSIISGLVGYLFLNAVLKKNEGVDAE